MKEIFIISKSHTHAIIPHGEEAPSSLVSVHPPLHLHQCNAQLLLGTVKAALVQILCIVWRMQVLCCKISVC